MTTDRFGVLVRPSEAWRLRPYLPLVLKALRADGAATASIEELLHDLDDLGRRAQKAAGGSTFETIPEQGGFRKAGIGAIPEIAQSVTLLNVTAVAHRLGVSSRRVRALATSGVLRGSQAPSGRWSFRLADVVELESTRR